jgi:flagellar basal-body rod protein FlgG
VLEGMYTAAAGMAAQQTRLDAVSNDLANVNTTGYKHERLAFRDLLYDDAAAGYAAKGVQLGAGAAATSIGFSTQQGNLQNTGRALDVGVQGQGFFQVKTADGQTALTRDGNLQIGSDGRLKLHTGQLVDPPIKVPAGTDENDVSVSSDGTITAKGAKLGQLKLVSVPAPGALSAGPDNTYLVSKGSGALTAAPKGTSFAGGTLESSNVDTSTAMTDMIQAQRAYELASKAITTQDEMLQVANGVKK